MLKCKIEIKKTVFPTVPRHQVQVINILTGIKYLIIYFNKIFIDFSSNTSSSDMNLSAILKGENMTCTCRQLRQDNLSKDISPCQFCIFQTFNQQRNDFLMAKELEKQLNKDNVMDYNLRKRSSSTHNMKNNTKSKKQVLMEKTNNKQ